MKRLVVVALLSLALGLSACGNDSSSNQSIVPSNGGANSGCDRFEDIDNLSTDEIVATWGEFTDALDSAAFEKDIRSKITGSGVWADLIAGTPEGGHGKYISEHCDLSSKQMNKGMWKEPGVEASALNDGYSVCEGIRDRGGAVPLLLTNERTHELLCPQLPFVPQSASSVETGSDRSSSGDCTATLNGKKGAVDVTTGELDCDEASEIITSSFEQTTKEQSKSVTVKKNGVTEWLCGISGAGTSEATGYDYKCDTPMGDIVIVWTAD